MLEHLRDKNLARKLADKIKELARSHLKIMHVCGTHEQVMASSGLRDLLPENIEVIQGPGCPVCVTPASEIDLAVELASRGNIVTTFGDMFKVPGSVRSLADSRADGGQVKVVYSISDAINLARESPDREVIHCAIGFETTAPTTAMVILDNPPINFSIISSHRLIPPAMEALLANGECKIDGFLAPGHVSTIIGSEPYEELASKYSRPIVIAGFEPVDVLYAIWMVLRQIAEGRAEVEIEYTRAVRPEGNPLAIEKMWDSFEISEANWRGLGSIPQSGLRLKGEFERFDAIKRFDIQIEDSVDIQPGCSCDQILKGLKYPWQCALFKTRCRPESPVGPCMVSTEGSCAIYYKYQTIDKNQKPKIKNQKHISKRQKFIGKSDV